MINVVKRGIQIGLMLLGLTGLVDNIVEWHGFISNIVEVYVRVRDWLFSHLSLELRSYHKDYLIIGCVVCSSWFRFLLLRLSPDRTIKPGFPSARAIIVLGFTLFYHVLFWPIIILVMLSVRRRKKSRDVEEEQIPTKDPELFFYLLTENSDIFFRDLLKVAAIFLGLLFVASDALSKLVGG